MSRLPTARRARHRNLRAAVPVDSGRTIFFHLFWKEHEPLRGTEQEEAIREFLGLGHAATIDFGLHRDRRDLPTSGNRANGWHQDRAAMRRGETFTGILNFLPEDVAVWESMSPVYAREYDQLLNSDLGVARMRRTLVDSASACNAARSPSD